MQRSKIEYLQGGYSWNPIKMRCDPVSEGCKNCWHLRFAKRHAANPTFSAKNRKAYSGDSLRIDVDELLAPTKVRKPAMIAVQFMGDIFHEDIRQMWLSDIFHVMHEQHQHTYLILTKRPKRMLEWMKHYWNESNGPAIDNIWLGVSVENQAAADERIPLLLQTPAAKRWISVEPMLGPVFFRDVPIGSTLPAGPGDRFGGPLKEGIDWVVCGGETGPHKRRMDTRDYSSLVVQCREAEVPFFGKVDSYGQPIGPRQLP